MVIGAGAFDISISNICGIAKEFFPQIAAPQ
jgi:hypothetical protein